MRDISDKLLEVLNSVAAVADSQSLRAYALRDTVLYLLVEESFLPNPIQIAIEGNFVTHDFYKSLIKYLTVEKEIENSHNRYTAYLSGGFIIDLIGCNSVSDLIKNERIEFNTVTYDLISKKFSHPDAKELAKTCNLRLRKGDTRELFEVVRSVGDYQPSISDDNLSFIKNIQLSDIRDDQEVTLLESIVDVFTTKKPGTALSFLIDNFKDGKIWLFNRLTNLMAHLNVPMSETVTPDSVLNEKKTSLVDVYNEYYLYNKLIPETPDQRTDRIKTSLRLLFDSPSISTPNPYIDKISVLMAPVEDAVELMGSTLKSDPCPYPPCECDPVECGQGGKEPCCCCHSIDIVSKVKVNCHKKIQISCDNTGLKPGPSEDNFPTTCGRCYETCASVLQTPVAGYDVPNWDICSQDANELPSWWNINPPTPCSCNCASSSGGKCNLTCVTCSGPNTFCTSEVEVSGYDCNYTFQIKPSSACCGGTSYSSCLFSLDVSGSMGDEIESVRDGISTIVNKLSESGTLASFSLTTFREYVSEFRWNADGTFSGSSGAYDYTRDADAFTTKIGQLTAAGGAHPGEWMYLGAMKAMEYNLIDSKTGVLVIVTDEPGSGPYTAEDVIAKAESLGIVIFYIGPINGNEKMATQTGGEFWPLTTSLDWVTVFERIADRSSSFPSSCDCLDMRPVYVRRDLNSYPWCECPNDPTGISCQDDLWKSHPECFLFPIGIRKAGDPPNRCKEPITIYACGHTMTVTPDYINEICCSDLVLDGGVSLGCSCPKDPPPSCCGPECIDICDSKGGSIFATVDQAQDAVWEKCVETRVGGNSTDTCLQMRSASGTTYQVCRDSIDRQTADWYWKCFWPEPEPSWKCVGANCDIKDECIVAHPVGSLSNNQCSNANKNNECVTVQKPAVVVLNNGVGLVAYETLDQPSKIRIQQFRTTSRHKLLPNRKLNFGRLQNPIGWKDDSSGYKIARLYSSDPIPDDLLHGAPGSLIGSDSKTWKDVIAFESGPIQGQCCPLAEPPVGRDKDLGSFVQFYVTSKDTFRFPSSDDIYNVKWFIYDANEPEGSLIGDSSNPPQNWPHANLMFKTRQPVDEILLSDRLATHIYNGSAVPVSNPFIATAYNYSNYRENSHHVFLTYQALEDGKWNVYIRQIRLSEYNYNTTRSSSTLAKIDELTSIPDSFVYRSVCASDRCVEFGSNYLLQRYVVFELYLPDGREVLNESFMGQGGYYGGLCPGVSDAFLKEKVYVQLIHSVVVNKCPNRETRDAIFYDWSADQEFTVSTAVSTGTSLYRSVTTGETVLPLGGFDPPLVINGVTITSSSVSATWYPDRVSGTWRVFSDDYSDIASQVMGMDMGEPICLTRSSPGHSTRPIVKVNYRNDVFVAYETDIEGIPQIVVVGTAEPKDILPFGYKDTKNLDGSMNYLIRPSDFVYEREITSQGINQSVDMFIDMNDVIHLTWQSNRDNRWEIYYGNSLNSFENIRITNAKGRSLRPRIDGSDDGKLYIVWHDNRFGSYEIMMAYHMGERLIPLFQQDPYLASIANYSDGWRHTTGDIEFELSNSKPESRCYTEIIAKFYTDRLLENQAFAVSNADYPFAFSINALQSDQSQVNVSSLDGWNVLTVTVSDGFGDPIGQRSIATSQEIDSFLADSVLNRITFPNLVGIGGLETFSVRASNFVLSSAEWSPEVDISGLDGNEISLNLLGIDSAYRTGRYKQLRFKFLIESSLTTVTLTGPGDDAVLTTSEYPIWDADNNSLIFGRSPTENKAAYLRFPIGFPKTTHVIHANLKLTAAQNVNGSHTATVALLQSLDTPSFVSSLVYDCSVDSSRSDAYYIGSTDGAETNTLKFGGQNLTLVRFPLDIPKGSIIDHASISFSAYENESGNTGADVFLINSDNCEEFLAFRSTVTQPINSSSNNAFLTISSSEPEYPNYHDKQFGELDWSVYGNVLRVGYFRSLDLTQTVYWDAYVTFTASIPASDILEDVLLKFTKFGTSSGQFRITRVSGIPNQGDPRPVISSDEILFNVSSDDVFHVSVDVTRWYSEFRSANPSATSITFTFMITSVGLNNVFCSFSAHDGAYTVPTLQYSRRQAPPVDTSIVTRWNVTSPWTSGSTYSSPNLKTQIEKWLGLQSAGYSSGKYIGFSMRGTASGFDRTVDSYDGSPALAPALTVTYRSGDDYSPSNIQVASALGNWSENQTYRLQVRDLVNSFIQRSGYSPGKWIGLRLYTTADDSLYRLARSFSYGSDYASLDMYTIPTFSWSMSFVNTTDNRLCLASGQRTNGILDLTPVVRIDSLGNRTIKSSLPVNWSKNKAYFVSLFGKEEDGTEDFLGDQKLSVSCDDCYRRSDSWSYISCSIPAYLYNDTEDEDHYEVRVRLYADSERNVLVREYKTTDPSDLPLFTVGNGVAATSVWTEQGIRVYAGGRESVSLWPSIHGTSQVVCGITYYVDVAIKSTSSEFVDPIAPDPWVCGCDSGRWENIDTPSNLRRLVRWKSSAFGSSDTRITETLSNNLNPSIRIRDNLEGVIVYESDRTSLIANPDELSHRKIYASVFSVIPGMNMHASSTESIDTPLEQLVHRSDIEICSDSGCYSINENGLQRTSNTQLSGSVPALEIDQYDNLFLAAERSFVNGECSIGVPNKQKYIVVHRCGADVGLDFDRKPPDAVKEIGTNSINKILSNRFVSGSVVENLVRISPDYVKYHVHYKGKLCPVVSKCDIDIEVIGPSKGIALRSRNKNKGEWSEWVPFHPLIGSENVILKHSLTKGSGIKYVQVQIATPAGLTETMEMQVVADYDRVGYSIDFFRPVLENSPRPPQSPVITDDMFTEENRLQMHGGMPVASIRQFESNLWSHKSDYIYVQIIPNVEYMKSLSDDQKRLNSPKFDVIQQGGFDSYNLTTVYHRDSTTSIESYRGAFAINQEDWGRFRDGLAYVIPHFLNDCSDPDSIIREPSGFSRDSYNVFGTLQESMSSGDHWASDRDNTGRIEYRVVVRPAGDDPYFVFGDPNYRLE